jgi:hypothetical protein
LHIHVPTLHMDSVRLWRLHTNCWDYKNLAILLHL